MLALRGRRREILLALDRSLRSIDADGHMRVEESRISKANICPYLGREIPNATALGLDPEKTYRLFRDPKELEKGASTFDGKPLLIRHVPIDADLPRKDLWVGTIGACSFEEPYLITRPLMVLTTEAIDLIDRNVQRELSAAYRYEAVMEPGTWGGQSYDGRMVNIRGNHVAIVSEGRAGPDVHVADELPLELRHMKAASAVVAAILAPLLKDVKAEDKRRIAIALDAALGETPAESVLSLDAEEMKACDEAAFAEKRKEHGEDAELTDQEKETAYEKARDKKKKARDAKARDAKKAADKRAADAKKARDEHEAAVDAREAAMDEAEEKEDEGKEDEKAKDRKKARDARKTARDKRAHDRGQDALPDPKDHRRDFRPNAEDTVTKDELPEILKAHGEGIRAQMREAAEAREKVRPLVGAVSVAMDSAPEIYKFALKHAGVKIDGVHDSALGALVDMEVTHRKRTTAHPAGASHAFDTARGGAVDFDSIFPTKAA